MKIWKLDFEVDVYDNLMPVKKISIDELRTFDGRPKKSEWKVIEVVRMEPERKLPWGNAPGFHSHIPAFDRKAVEVLQKFLVNSAEILPLKNSEKDFYAINVIRVVDCIDYEKSAVKLFSDGGIMRFKKYAFIESKIRGLDLFKIKDEPRRKPFVSDEFKNAVEAAGLEGFEFILAWDSEAE